MRYLPVLMLLVLSACTSTGTKVDQEKLSSFVKGKTTYSEVIQQLGKPDQSETHNDGTVIIIYTHKESVAKVANFIPFAGGFIEGGAGSEDTTVAIKFDNKSVLVGYTVSELDENNVKKITKRQ
jgi:outer membrane protein assembly factor BamE (lipoprotein component of BamABCDE complex)